MKNKNHERMRDKNKKMRIMKPKSYKRMRQKNKKMRIIKWNKS